MKKRQHHTCRLNVEELEGRLVPSAVSATTSTNWSGYAVTAATGAVTAVSGSWVVPTVSGTGTSYSSAWVGIDGYSSNSVEQIGTDSDVSNGKATYYAWYEMYPAGMVTISSLTISATNAISASVSYSANKFSLTIKDTTTGKSFTTTQTMSGAQRSSAEWILEAPSSNFGVLPLADFKSINFSAAQATISGTTGSISNLPSKDSVNQINMVSDETGATETTTSALSNNGTSFSVTYDATSTTTPAPTPTPPTPPSRHHHWWFATNQSATAILPASAMGTFTANPSLSQTVPSTSAVTVQSTTAASSPAGVSSAVLPGWVRPSDDTPVNNPPANPDTDDAPSDQPSVPSNPQGTATSPAAVSPSSPDLQGTTGMEPWAADACFTEGGWRPTPAGGFYGRLVGQDGEEGTPFKAAMGVLLTIGLGTGWGKVREETVADRQRPKLR